MEETKSQEKSKVGDVEPEVILQEVNESVREMSEALEKKSRKNFNSSPESDSQFFVSADEDQYQ